MTSLAYIGTLGQASVWCWLYLLW